MKEAFKRKINEECGVVAVFNCHDASEIVFYGLHALQHRGQEGCGIVCSNNGDFKLIKGAGLVHENFNESTLKKLVGDMGIGHVNYPSIRGGNDVSMLQPYLFRHCDGDFAIANNGSMVNYQEIRLFLEHNGSIFQSNSDAEMIAHLIKKEQNSNMLEAIKGALNKLEGSFACVIMTEDKIYACRDKHGFKPLSLGKLNGGYVVVSESCAFELCVADPIRDIEPGEILVISKDGLHSEKYAEDINHHMCAMEYIYFARPDSEIEGVNVHLYRRETGRLLAKESPVEADVVVGVPDSSLSAAMGYAEESGIPNETGLIKNKYVGRTFIQPSQRLREKTVRMKLSTVSAVVRGKRVILVDDSIVRGTTSKRIVTLLKESGAKEVHVRICSPQMMHPCYYGVDTSNKVDLIGAFKTIDEIKEAIGADSLAFLTVDSLYKAGKRLELCTACFSGLYPTKIYE